jgi:hypothetical protein
MDDSESTSLEQIRAFLAGGGEVRFAGERREDVYAWVEQTLVWHQYASVQSSNRRQSAGSDVGPLTGTR